MLLNYGIRELQKQEDMPDKNILLKTRKLQNQMVIEFFSVGWIEENNEKMLKMSKRVQFMSRT